MLSVLEVVGHHEIDDDIFKVLQDKEKARLQIQPSEQGAQKRGSHTHHNVISDGPVQRGLQKKPQFLVDRHPGEPAEPYDRHKKIVRPESDAAAQGAAFRCSHNEFRAQEHGKDQDVEGDLGTDKTQNKNDHGPCNGESLGRSESRNHHGERDEDEEQKDERQNELKRRLTSVSLLSLGKELFQDYFHGWTMIR